MSEGRPCRCGRGPRRKGQRNCRLCHAEANRRYRARVKMENEVLRQAKADGRSRRTPTSSC